MNWPRPLPTSADAVATGVSPAADRSGGAFLAPEPRALKAAYGSFPSGVTAIAALVDEEPVGLAASSFTGVSLEPPLVLACFAASSLTWPLLRTAPSVGISILGGGQGGLGRRLAGPAGERFTGTPWSSRPGGAVLLGGAAAALECGPESEYDAGDHTIAVFRVLAVSCDPAVRPLLYHRGALADL